MIPQQLPTLDNLDVTEVLGVSPAEKAKEWFNAFALAIQANDSASVPGLFLGNGSWRDILALTWDFRTFTGQKAIRQLLDKRLQETGLHTLRLHLSEDALRAPALLKILPNLVLLRFSFAFETRHGKGSGVCHLAPTPNGGWKAYTLLTHLESLRDFPEKVGPTHPPIPNLDTWQESRHREVGFTDEHPTVLVIGAGHTGLEIAARLKHMGVPVLVIDKNARIGDNWRNRYKALSLHDTVWYNQTPYLNFPSSWPTFSPAAKLADWIESYASHLDLDVWTSSVIHRASWDDTTKTWTVHISQGELTRVLTVRHLVFATGLTGGGLRMPDIPGKETFRGSVVHSSSFKSADEYIGRTAVVVGAGNSAHDIAHDFFNHGVDVTMVQRSSTYVISSKANAASLGGTYNDQFPVELADLYGAAFPFAVLKLILQYVVPGVANTVDRQMIEGLERVGFKTNLGLYGAGLIPLALERGGGFYIDTGASQRVIDGDIKIKNGVAIERFTEHGLRFVDGTELTADVVVFATGFGDPRDIVREVCGPEVVQKVKPMWGLDGEGELRGTWRESGCEGLWFGLGNLAMSRFHSTHLALQIKAIEEGILRREEM
ncbi:FAD/NAD(P)-binding domain-containing protein [Leucogyrophana mollusca]|uniref:FAD/NAD(P)-binding domain-containing protein n=1 Tax=Leucogyrophana mollusca TaxID=85980 RepID=A0ACB8BUY1_9AGAM|nr:FAD/NAD(P)-binding domain-containing protein [Leucogyrophana mollusca]